TEEIGNSLSFGLITVGVVNCRLGVDRIGSGGCHRGEASLLNLRSQFFSTVLNTGGIGNAHTQRIGQFSSRGGRFTRASRGSGSRLDEGFIILKLRKESF